MNADAAIDLFRLMLRRSNEWSALGRWDLQTLPGVGIEVLYANLVTGQTFVCGLVRADTCLTMIIAFISSAGDPGDVVFLDGQFCCYLLPSP